MTGTEGWDYLSCGQCPRDAWLSRGASYHSSNTSSSKSHQSHGCGDRWIAYAGRDDAVDDVGIYALGIVQVFEFGFRGKGICSEPIEELQVTSADRQR